MPFQPDWPLTQSYPYYLDFMQNITCYPATMPTLTAAFYAAIKCKILDSSFAKRDHAPTFDDKVITHFGSVPSHKKFWSLGDTTAAKKATLEDFFLQFLENDKADENYLSAANCCKKTHSEVQVGGALASAHLHYEDETHSHLVFISLGPIAIHATPVAFQDYPPPVSKTFKLDSKGPDTTTGNLGIIGAVADTRSMSPGTIPLLGAGGDGEVDKSDSVFIHPQAQKLFQPVLIQIQQANVEKDLGKLTQALFCQSSKPHKLPQLSIKAASDNDTSGHVEARCISQACPHPPPPSWY